MNWGERPRHPSRPVGYQGQFNTLSSCPGTPGLIGIVTNQASFNTPAGQDKLVLELFRDGGLQQAYIVLERKLKP